MGIIHELQADVISTFFSATCAPSDTAEDVVSVFCPGEEFFGVDRGAEALEAVPFLILLVTTFIGRTLKVDVANEICVLEKAG